MQVGEAGGTAVKSGEAPLKLRVKKKGRGILNTSEVPSSPEVEDVFRASFDAEEERRSKKELQSLEALSGLSFEDDSLADYRVVAGNRRQGGPGVGSSNNVGKGVGKKNERAPANLSREIVSFGSGPWGNTAGDYGTTRPPLFTTSVSNLPIGPLLSPPPQVRDRRFLTSTPAT